MREKKNSWQDQTGIEQIQHEHQHSPCSSRCVQAPLIYMGNSCSDPSRIKIASLERSSVFLQPQDQELHSKSDVTNWIPFSHITSHL